MTESHMLGQLVRGIAPAKAMRGVLASVLMPLGFPGSCACHDGSIAWRSGRCRRHLKHCGACGASPKVEDLIERHTVASLVRFAVDWLSLLGVEPPSMGPGGCVGHGDACKTDVRPRLQSSALSTEFPSGAIEKMAALVQPACAEWHAGRADMGVPVFGTAL